MSTTSSQTVQVVLPELGESVTEGVVVEWRVAEGDEVRAGDTLLDVTTDKVDVEVPSPASGEVAKIVAQPGEAVEVGALLAELRTGDGSEGDGRAPGAAPTAPEAPAEPPPRRAARLTSCCRTWSRSPRAWWSSGASRSARPWPRSRPWWRSRPTRSTSRCRRPPPGPWRRSPSRPGRPSRWASRSGASRSGLAAARPPGTAQARRRPRHLRPRPRPPPRRPRPATSSGPASAPSRAAWRSAAGSTRRRSGARVRAAWSARPTCSPPRPARRRPATAGRPRRPRRRRPARRRSRSAARPRRWPATWTRASRSRPPRASAPSASGRSTPSAAPSTPT